jgi:hypothetical protein
MKRTATIILNRNLPDVTNALHDHLLAYDGDTTDVYVVEAGSDDDRLSRHCTWHARWPEARSQGLRYCRGMNYGLSRLWQEGRFQQYDAFLLLTNDTEFHKAPTVAPLMAVLDEHPHLGILSPCAKRWGEKLLLKEQGTKYFWFIHNNALLLRRDFIESVCDFEDAATEQGADFLFDGRNFRGYGSESELIAKAYANDWAAAITTRVLAEENESHLLNKADLIKTESQAENLRLYVDEGRAWMRRKYGFNSRWSMQQYVKGFYDKFFAFHPEYQTYRV